MLRSLLPMALPLLLLAACACANAAVLLNPTRRDYPDELVRLKDPAPGPAGTFVVRLGGEEVPYQVEEIDGVRRIWVCATFGPKAQLTFDVVPGIPKTFPTRVSAKREGDSLVLENGLVAVKLPAVTAEGRIPGPITGVKLGDAWVGGSTWTAALPLKAFAATIIGDGMLFAKVRLRYDFDGMGGIGDATPAFAEVDVALGPGWKHAAIAERHAMRRHDGWELAASAGWAPTEGRGVPHWMGAGSGEVGKLPAANRPLRPGAVPLQPDELFLNLFPRWNQHYKDGWSFGATDGKDIVGAVVVRAGQWIWPHENSLRAVVKPAGDYAGVRCPTWKGQRLWWLMAGPVNTTPVGDNDYVMRRAVECLDKLNEDFILEWPGKTGDFWGINPYDGNNINPTGAIRQRGRAAIANAGKTGDIGTLTQAQAMFHPDTYGNYWLYWSPENPNFYTDFVRVPIALTCQLREHPRFEELRRRAELALREDVYHSVTMPSGASQECPGYVGHALGGWSTLAPVCKQYLGFDPMAWPEVKAVQRFSRRISYPDGGVRRASPLGDSHPDRAGGTGMARVSVDAAEVKGWTTEELQGFGVVFTNNPGTDRETYMSFKAGPNRGHFHGDQLSFHFCANVKPVAVDHHCSYSPRAGQEHMHNRVSFGTDAMPWANMDGYERLIGFKTSAVADIAIGQVESDRLRHVQQFPPEQWHEEYPQVPFATPLNYRRTIVMVKGGAQDYFVIRDQYAGPMALNATYALHTYGDTPKRNGQTIDFGKLTLFCATPFAKFESFPWEHTNGGKEHTEGARLTITGATGEFITVVYPGKAPAMTAVPGGVTVGDDTVTFAGGLDHVAGVTYATVTRAGQVVLALTGADINMDRPQGTVGLFVPDAGYPFGDIPDWLAKQRMGKPAWAL